MDKSINNYSEFDLFKLLIQNQKHKIFNLKKILKKEENTLKNNIMQLQNICNHDYIRECTTSGCYAEYHYICKLCNKVK